MATAPRRAPWIREAIGAGRGLAPRGRRRWRHNLLNLVCLCGLLSGIAGVLWLSARAPVWVALTIAPALLGTLLFGVFVLVVHECSHGMFVVLQRGDRTRRLNHLIGAATATVLLTDYATHWRRGHPLHHRAPCVPEDAQYNHIYSGRELVGHLLRLLLVPGYALVLNPSRRFGVRNARVGVAILLWAGFAGVATAHLSWSVPAAALLGFNHLQFWNLQRKTQEHGAGLKDEPDALFRSRTWWSPLGFWGAPFFINYHFEHHLNPSVPWYRLPTYHRRVRALVPPALHPLVFTQDYLGQLWGRRPRYTPELMRLVTGDEAEAGS